MSEAPVATEPSRGHARITYTGAVSPHWVVYSDFGDPNLLEEFRARVLARRNQERVNRDAERERISVEWELGYNDAQ
jgi:hypothetical protein